MHETIDIPGLLVTVIFTLLGIFIPMIFHLFGLGSVFLPMFLPLAVGAFLMSPRNALLMGAVTPLVSALGTGMPPFYPPVAAVMVVELSIFCLIISLLQHGTKLPRMAVLSIAILADRAVLVLLYMFIMPRFHISFKAFTLYDTMKSLPGIVLMLVLVPVLVPLSQRILKSTQPRLYELSSGEED